MAAALALLLLASGGCASESNGRIPAVPVSINLADAGLWNTYGVAGLGSYRYFVRPEGEPRGFAYTAGSATGFGGVLLMGGMDPFSGEANVPLAYDMACPVECQPDVRVGIDAQTLEAVCPKCGSRYDVLTAGGAPVGGPALTGSVKRRLQTYHCIPGSFGGYTITR